MRRSPRPCDAKLPLRGVVGQRKTVHRQVSAGSAGGGAVRDDLPEERQFVSLEAAQDAIDGWVESYNHYRPHQSLDMASPASLFRPNGPTRIDVPEPAPEDDPELPSTMQVQVIEPSAAPATDGAAVELELRVPPSGETGLVSGKQRISLHRSLAGRTVTVWADLRSVHVLLDGNLLTTVPSRLSPEDLAALAMRGARSAGRHRRNRHCGGSTGDPRFPPAKRSRSTGGSPKMASSPGPAPFPPNNCRVSSGHSSRPRLCRRHRCQPDRSESSDGSTPPAGSWSLNSASNSANATLANSSPSSSKTPNGGAAAHRAVTRE